MENADALDLSKENIQPLKRGRNTAQLGLALQAQNDTTLHQMLSKKQEWYEMQIRTYEGSDPLELWCDYISWVEQSFPKHGPEGNLSILLTKCFQAFKDEEKYKNDLRFVGLWIKYIEMQNDAKRVELYQLLHTQGIGVRCAKFYQSWAFEFQCAGDWKQADQIFKKGSSYMAQPADELHASHQQFLASYVFAHKNINNEPPEDEIGNHGQVDQRLPMAALKAVGKKCAAPTVRVGANVRSQLPGVVPAMQGSSGRAMTSSRSFGVRGNNAGPVAVYQEHGEPEAEVIQSQNIPSALPIAQTINKENVVKAGPWTGQGLGSRKHQTSTIGHSFASKQPGFEVHKDEEDPSSGQDGRSHGIVMPNALKPRKGLEDGFQDAIAIFEEPNPFTKPMYRKNEVYAGGKEFQLEEIRALDYFRKKAENDQKMRESNNLESEQNAFYQRKYLDSVQSGSGSSPQNNQYITQEKSAPFYEEPQGLNRMPEHPFEQPCSTSSSVPSLGSTPSSYFPSQSSSAYGNAEPAAHCSGQVSHLDRPQIGQKYNQPNQSMHNQSMTLHTKLAMHEINNLWGTSPTVVKGPHCEENLPAPSSANVFQPAFQIMKDDSLSHQAHENTPLKSQLPSYPHDPQGLGAVHASAQHHPMMTTNNYESPKLFEEPPTSTDYVKHHNGFQVYQEPSYPPNPIHSGKFQVFCDDADTAPSTCTPSYERGDLSVSAHTSGSIQRVAKEKENIHKFPQADIELMDECGVTPVADVTEPGMQQHHSSDYPMTSAYNLHMQNHPMPFADQQAHGTVPSTNPALSHGLIPTSCSTSVHQPLQSIHQIPHQPMHSTHSLQNPSYNVYNGPPSYDQRHCAMPHATHHPGSTSQPVHQAPQEAMEEDTAIASAPQYAVNMSETGITEAFFFPKMAAESTPFKTSPKKSRSSKSTIDFNSSLYRVEQSWPDEDEDSANRSPHTPKTVPPLKLFRIKNNEGDQLSAIMETSKEKYQSIQSSGRNSFSASINSRFGMHAPQRQSLAPQPCLNQIEESTEPSSSVLPQEVADQGLNQEQAVVLNQAQSSGPDAQQMSELSVRLAKGDINPFDSRLLEQFLSHMGFPLSQHADGYHSLNSAVPAKRNNCLTLNGDVYTIGKVLGEGAYAKVLKAVNANTQKDVALKIQKPSCRWEYYICREIRHRLSQQELAQAFMPADQIYVYSNGSVIVTDFLPFGTLLNLVNKVVAATKRQMQELQILYIIEQLMGVISALHSCKIIHGDLKPDNILIRAIPGIQQSQGTPCIQLIDFGRSIDMQLMPEGTTFNQIVLTDTFTCIEMRTGRPWTYQTDLFGLANTAHCLIFGDYMKVQESRTTGRWTIQSKLPRALNSDFWGTFFDTLLNIESCEAIPDLETLRADAQACMSNVAQLTLSVSALGRILLSR